MTEVYFGAKKTEKFFLDASKEQYIEYKKLNEGERAQYQDSVTGDVVMNTETKEVKIQNRMGADRASLCKLAVCGFKLATTETEFITDFTVEKWSEIYDLLDSDIAQKLFDAISEFNGFTDKKK